MFLYYVQKMRNIWIFFKFWKFEFSRSIFNLQKCQENDYGNYVFELLVICNEASFDVVILVGFTSDG